MFTPAYGSVTNVRINSTMTTPQVLKLLLNKFKASSLCWLCASGPGGAAGEALGSVACGVLGRGFGLQRRILRHHLRSFESETLRVRPVSLFNRPAGASTAHWNLKSINPHVLLWAAMEQPQGLTSGFSSAHR